MESLEEKGEIETRRLLDLRETRISSVRRFWTLLINTLLPLSAGITLALIWSRTEKSELRGHLDLLLRFGLPTLATACFIDLYSRSVQRLRRGSLFLSLAFLWFAVAEIATTLYSSLALSQEAAAHPVDLETLMLINFGTSLLIFWASLRTQSATASSPRFFGRFAFSVAGLAGLVPIVIDQLITGPSFLVDGLRWLCLLALPVYGVAGWRFILDFRAEFEPLRLTTALATIGALVAQVLLFRSHGSDGDDGVFLARMVLFCSFLAPLTTIVAKDIFVARRSLPAQVRLTFNSMVMLIFCGMAAVVIGMNDGMASLNSSHALHGIFALQQRATILLGAIATAITCMAMLLANLACRRFLDNVENLVDATRQLAQGKLDALVETRGGDELAAVSCAFNAMAERVFLQTRELRILARVMDGTSDPVVVLDPNHHIVYSNNAFTTRTGWERRHTIGRRYDDLFTEQNSQRKVQELWTELEQGGNWTGEIAVDSKLDGRFESFVNASPVIYEGRTIQYVAVHRDLSVLKRLETERSSFARNLVKIHKVAQNIVKSLELDEVKNRAIEGLEESFGVNARVWRIEQGDICRSCTMRKQCADTSHCLQLIDSKRVRLPIDHGLPGYAVASGDRAVCFKPEEEPSFFEFETAELKMPGARVAYPLIACGETIGVLELGIPNPEHGRLIDSVHLLAQILAEAISNASLLQRMKQQTGALERLTKDLESRRDCPEGLCRRTAGRE